VGEEGWLRLTVLDLFVIQKRYFELLGVARVAEIVGCDVKTASHWAAGDGIPIAALQALIAADPTPIHEVTPLYVNPVEAIQLSIIVPSASPVGNWTRKCIDKLMAPGMAYEPESYNSLYHVRNMAAARFMKSGRDWSFWSDADMLHPCGDAKWFKETSGRRAYPDVYAGMNTIFRLLAHKKTIASVVYIEKTNNKPHVMFQGGDEPLMRASIARGPREATVQADWCGFGGVLVHRTVFEDIANKGHAPRLTNLYMRQKLGYEWGFFNPVEEHFGDDISFCARAKAAGHVVTVDLALLSEHLGTRPYGYEDLREAFRP
jgi:hypothetical protein